MTDPDVSLVIPAYNAEAFLGQAVASALAQESVVLEILIVDDCSTDATFNLARRWASADRRITVLQTVRNGGPSLARNLALDAARGRWIGLLDADDAMESGRLRALLDLAARRNAQMVSDNILLVPEAEPQAAAAMAPASLLSAETQLSLSEFIHRNVGSTRYPGVNYGFMKPLMSRAFLNRHDLRYDELVRFAEDFALYVGCLNAGAEWWIDPRPMYRYLIRGNSLTQIQSSNDLDRLRRRQRQLLQDPKIRENTESVLAIRRHLRVIDRCYYYRSFTDAVKARRWREAIGILVSSPDSVPLIFQEGLTQAPIIARKALQGGYGRA